MPNLDQQLCFEIYKAANQFTKFYTKALRPFSLTYPQYLVLLALYEENKQSTSSLCKKLQLSIGTLNPIITKLIEKKWLEKSEALDDRRKMIVSLSDHAIAMENNIQNAISEQLQCFHFLQENGPMIHQEVEKLNIFLNTVTKEEKV